jgi:predicted O-methyltransferase YrrM
MTLNKNRRKFIKNAREVEKKTSQRMSVSDQRKWMRHQRKLRWKHPAYNKAQPEEAEVNAWTVIGSMEREGELDGVSGRRLPTQRFITPGEERALYEWVLKKKPALALEVGLAHGYSTLAILQALAEKACGRLISIDPYQLDPSYDGAGLMNVRRAGLDGFHMFSDQMSHVALPAFIADGVQVDFAFIDGNHLFDFTLVEFFFVDRLLRDGGIIVFHDYQFPAVRGCLNFIEANYHYDVLPTDEKNLRVVRKLKADDRPWYHSIAFEVPQISWTSLENRVMCD